MPKLLSSAAVEAYKRDGYYFPVPALTDSVPADVSTSMILSDSSSDLPDSSGAFEPVSTANLLATDSAPESVEPASTEELSTDAVEGLALRHRAIRTERSVGKGLRVSLCNRCDRRLEARIIGRSNGGIAARYSLAGRQDDYRSIAACDLLQSLKNSLRRHQRRVAIETLEVRCWMGEHDAVRE